MPSGAWGQGCSNFLEFSVAFPEQKQKMTVRFHVQQSRPGVSAESLGGLSSPSSTHGVRRFLKSFDPCEGRPQHKQMASSFQIRVLVPAGPPRVHSSFAANDIEAETGLTTAQSLNGQTLRAGPLHTTKLHAALKTKHQLHNTTRSQKHPLRLGKISCSGINIRDFSLKIQATRFRV